MTMSYKWFHYSLTLKGLVLHFMSASGLQYFSVMSGLLFAFKMQLQRRGKEGERESLEPE